MDRVFGCMSTNPPRTLFAVSWYVLGVAFLYIYMVLDGGGQFKDEDASLVCTSQVELACLFTIARDW